MAHEEELESVITEKWAATVAAKKKDKCPK